MYIGVYYHTSFTDVFLFQSGHFGMLVKTVAGDKEFVDTTLFL